jgi:uridine kinase
MTESVPIRPAQRRPDVQVTLPDGRILAGPIGTRLESFIRAANLGPVPIMAALVNGRLRELTHCLHHDAAVEPLSMATSDGMRIYQRSLTFLLVVAAQELYPGVQIIVDHSITRGGYFCEVQGRPNFTATELAQIESRMREIVNADEPIEHQHISIEEAIKLFERQGFRAKVRLLRANHNGRTALPLYTLRGVHDYFYGYMVPSAGYLRFFALRPAAGGFVLLFPRRDAPTELPHYTGTSKLTEVFGEHRDWMRVMGIEDVASLNDAVANGRMREIILVAEALHERRVAEIAGKIAAARGKYRLVLIAGPSSSGKTTFAKRLAVQILAQGGHPVSLGLDDYFVDREKTPRDEKGDYDFEALEALNLELFNRQLVQLLRGEEVQLPRYNFSAGRSEPGRKLALSPEHVILIEGIHGLNPRLVADVPAGAVFRIYVSALTQLNLDCHNRIPTTDTRLIRRIVRDAAYRGYSALKTIANWESVLRGERRYIYPYQDNADEMFNSALLYELAVLKPLVEPLLRQIEPHDTSEYIEAHRLLAFLSWFLPSAADAVPDNSLLREFIGGSSLENFSY